MGVRCTPVRDSAESPFALSVAGASCSSILGHATILPGPAGVTGSGENDVPENEKSDHVPS